MRRVPTGMKHYLSAVAAALVLGACAGDAPNGDADANTAAPAPVAPVTTVDSTGVVADSGLAPVSGGELRPSANGTATAPASQPGSAGATAPPTVKQPPAAQPAAPTAPATEQEDGAAILRRAAAAYENVRSLRANFVMHFNNPLLKQQQTSRGTLYQRRPDRIAVRFSDPAGDILLSDGEHFYQYYPSVNPQQVLKCAAAAGAAGGVDLQAQFIGNPVERFQFTLHGTETVDGSAAHVITLVPRQAPEYRSLKVWLDTRDTLARRFEITEHNGTVRRFDLDDMVVNATIPDATFRFTPPEGARVASIC